MVYKIVNKILCSHKPLFIRIKEFRTFLEKILITERDKLYECFKNSNMVTLIKDFYHYRKFWWYPMYFDWNVASPALAFYTEFYPYFDHVFLPNYFVFTKNSVFNLINYRLDYFSLWKPYVSKNHIRRYLPRKVWTYIEENNNVADFDKLLDIHNSYGSSGIEYIRFIEKMTNQDLTDFYEFLNVKKLVTS